MSVSDLYCFVHQRDDDHQDWAFLTYNFRILQRARYVLYK
jgi:hypothetical protein